MTKICIIGVGYVGLKLFIEFSKIFDTIGFDISKSRVDELNKTYNTDKFTTDENMLKDGCLYCIAVPTLLKDDNRSVEDKNLKSAIQMVAKYAKSGSCIVIESSVYVGMTRLLLSDIREKGIYFGFSPERVDPGRIDPAFSDIPKIISGYDKDSLLIIEKYYSKIFKTLVHVSNIETAEMCKLFENCFRMINIAYVNEISDTCSKHDIDVSEMINASSTKPFGYMKFTPGLGIGGHCIPVNPYYLFINNNLPLLEHATTTTHQRPLKKAEELCKLYPDIDNILVVGQAFKPGESLTIFSPAHIFTKELIKLGKNVTIYDPFIEEYSKFNWTLEEINKYPYIIIAMKQINIDYSLLENYKGKIIYNEQF
jgi:nucleotide sugar dehydrogenase